MDRSIFGSWALELSDDDLGPAVAALGISLRWNRYADKFWVTSALRETAEAMGGTPLSWRMPNGWREPWPYITDQGFDHGPTVWAEGWRDFLSQFGAPQIETWFPLNSDHFDILKLLSGPQVHAQSIYARIEKPIGEVRWNWPLRIGFLSDIASQSLYCALVRLLEPGQTGWRRDYIQLCRPGQIGSLGCHILLLPAELESSLVALSSSSELIRTACVFSLGSTKNVASANFVLSAIRIQARAEGVALVDIPPVRLKRTFGRFFENESPKLEDLWAAWFIDFARELSHNKTLDDALYTLWHVSDRAGPPPCIFASRRLIQESKISKRLSRLAVQMRAPNMAEEKLKIGPNTAYRLGTQEGVVDLKTLGFEIAKNASRFEYYHEGDEGTAILEMVDAFRQVRQKQPARPPRWVQGYVYASTGGRLRELPLRQFRSGITHIVELFIGTREIDTIQPPIDAPPLPEGGLPDDRGVMLTIVFAESAKHRKPQIAKVFLPREGRSSSCRFTVTVDKIPDWNITHIEARIIVLYRNRVLQTSLLRGPISTNKEFESDEITITPEVVVHDNLEGLESRSDFDATLVLNHGGDGIPAITTVHDENAERFPLSDAIKDAVKVFDEFMETTADETLSFGSLNRTANVKLLRDMAQKGRLLWDSFEETLPFGVDMSKYDRLQVVSVDPDTRLPVEFFYDLPAPSDDAKLCPGAKVALETGGRCEKCLSRDSSDNSVVCPLGFWGLRKILERHLYKRGDVREPENELRLATPVTGRKTLRVLGHYLFAASQRVDSAKSGGIAKVLDALKESCGIRAEPIIDWDEWLRQIRANTPNLLVLLPHVTDDGSQSLEIGVSSRVKAEHITTEHIRMPVDREPAPFVVLLGCKTGNPSFQFCNLVGPFRRKGAAVVMCTGAPILGRYAAPVAVALLDALKQATDTQEPRSLGDVMLDVRRKMVRGGLPMIFTVLAFGDLDWQIARNMELVSDMSEIPAKDAEEREGLLVTS